MTTSHPPIPAEVDLRGLEYMPLLGNHLFGSEFNAMASDSAWRAALTLWWKAWNQVPAGSLPNDDTALCRLADLGRDVKGWRKLKDHALHGFVLCTDGRLYHPFLCEQAMVAWDKRVKERERKAKWRAEKDAKNAGRNADVPRDRTVAATGTRQSENADVPADETRRDVTGRDGVLNATTTARAPAIDNEVIRMAADWTPGPSFTPQAKLMGIPVHNAEDMADGLNEFRAYWLARPDTLRTQAEWDNALAKSLKHRQVSAASRPQPTAAPRRTGSHAGFQSKDYTAGVNPDGTLV